MSAIEMNSITGAGSAAAARVASALAPKDAKAAAGTAAGTTSSTPAGTITSSDFMTLLVTELKNQDPTQPTDPNAYIQQLVGVNSLQQLISINQDLAPVANPAPTTGS